MTVAVNLGRLVHHDPQSRNYAAARAAQPRSVLWRHKAPVLDQFYTSACTGFAMANCLNTAAFVASRPKRRYLDQEDALDLYSVATRLDEFPWIWPPDDEGSSGLGVAKAGVQIGYLSSYRHAFGFDHFAASLQLSPLIVGTAWHESMFSPDSDGFVRPDGDVVGGHEYMACGINHYNKVLTFVNSWGPGWGARGRFHMTFNSFASLLADDGDATVPIGR